ncbi:MAG: class I SAM-dependent methyltransferase [Acidobacteriaceae bacterium]|nr:class I SAM-dependent methyltransferase [Acidobacteriaceae bacterium]MBV9500776.1 class I SAM-dependent methyltransferase [Acidobacteriaceae bacterium]
MENTDTHWKQWGKLDPYHGVLFQEKYKRSSLDENLSEFFDTGESYIGSLMKYIELLYPGLPRRTAVDFGCGVGRLSIPLAKRFENVIAVDISPAMLDEARKNCASFGVSNTEFVSSDDLVSKVPSGVQLVQSYIVFQHIPVNRGLPIAKHLLKRLAPGGVCALHVPVDRDPSRLKRLVYFCKHALPGSRYLLNLLQGKTIDEPLMQINPYPIRAVYDLLDSAGLRDIWLLPEPGSHYSVIWFGRKG